MPDDTDSCWSFDPADLDEEQKVDLINQLHAAGHEVMDQNQYLYDVIQDLGYSLRLIANATNEDNKFGKRKTTLTVLLHKLHLISQLTLRSINITEKDVQAAEEFTDVVSSLVDDPQFNKGDKDDQQG